jgi:enoyl-CoA hydratase
VSGELVARRTIGAVRIISLNRPEKRNPLNFAVAEALLAALRAAEADPAIRAVVLTGAGPSFCAGADRAEAASLTPDNEAFIAARAGLFRDLHLQLVTMPKPVAAAARGAVVGAGAGLLTACDLAVVGADLRLSYPENRLGLVPALVVTGLQRRVGVARAFELLTLSRVIDADEALRFGIVNRVVPPDQVVDAALEIAEVWAATPAPVLAATKALLRRIADLPFAQALEEGARVNTATRSGKTG